MITLGDCSDCTPCGGGGGHCDLFAFVTAGTKRAIGNDSLFSANEGADITLTVARLPDCFRYPGTPADYETENGSPPPVADGDYFYDSSTTGEFWLNTGGVFSQEPAPAWFGVGEIDIDWTLACQSECGCPHMLTAASGTLTWADGDTSDQTIIAPVTCPGPPTYWPCAGYLAGGESGTVTLEVASETGGCANVGYTANIVGLCTHAPPFPDWGTNPYFFRTWAGHDAPSTGWQGANGTGRFLSYEITIVGASDTTHLTGRTFSQGNILAEFTSEFGQGSPGVGGSYFYDIAQRYPDGIISDSEFYKDLGGGESIAFTLSDLSGSYAFPVETFDPDTNLAAARGLYEDGLAISDSYGWDFQGTDYTYTVKGDQFYWSGSFDPDTYYTAVGSDWTAIPFEDWTVTSDPGAVFVQSAATDPQALGLYNFTRYGVAGRERVSGETASEVCWETDVDATNSKLGNPVPRKVEIRLLHYRDGVLDSTGAWQEITDSVYTVPAPADLGGASINNYFVAEVRTTNLDESCEPSVSPVFVCHPGLTSCP